MVTTEDHDARIQQHLTNQISSQTEEVHWPIKISCLPVNMDTIKSLFSVFPGKLM